VEFCLRVNTCQVVPVFAGTVIKAHPESVFAE
jgi:hypothetical protein